MDRLTLGNLELSVLLAVARLDEDAYGVAIRRDVGQRLERDYSVGAIYTTLERLQAKGLVSARVTEPTPVRGGRARRLFAVTGAGRTVIHEAQQVTQSMWSGIGQPLAPRPA